MSSACCENNGQRREITASTCSLNTVGNYKKISRKLAAVFPGDLDLFTREIPAPVFRRGLRETRLKLQATIDIEDDGLWSMAVAFSLG
jgi:hypothetical protein